MVEWNKVSEYIKWEIPWSKRNFVWMTGKIC